MTNPQRAMPVRTARISLSPDPQTGRNDEHGVHEKRTTGDGAVGPRAGPGAWLILELDVVFAGYVKNTTNNTLRNVRVEVQLYNGVKLGPEVIGDMAPGTMQDVKLMAMRYDLMAPFIGWTSRAEVGGEGGGEGGSG